jgi:hypothetical protein
MMIALLRKELREQRRVIVVCGLLVLSSLCLELLTNVPDQRPLSQSFEGWVGGGGGASFVLLLLCIWIAGDLIVREVDEKTIYFFDSLPTSRDALFLAKFAVAFSILLVIELAGLGVAAGMQWLSSTSLESGGYATVLLPTLVADSAQIFIVLSLALLLAFLRGFAWLMAFLLMIAWETIEVHAPGLAWLNLTTLGAPVFEGSRRLLPERLWLDLVIGGACFGAAWLLFRGGRDSLLRLVERLPALVTALLWILGLTAFGVGQYALPESDDDDVEQEEVTFPEWNTSTGSSRYYQFSYPTNLSSRAEQVLAAADDAHQRVRDFLGTHESHRIPVDLSGADKGTAGTSLARAIRVDLASSSDISELTAILAHETVHVFVDRLTRERVSGDSETGRFFHEGLATYVEHRFFRRPEEQRRYRLIAGVMRARDEVRFEEAIVTSSLNRRLDHELAYILGAVFFRAVVDRYGDDAPGRVLAAIGRPAHDEELVDLVLWRDAFQASGYDLDQAVAEFYLALDEEKNAHRDRLGELPRLYGAFSVEDEHFRIEPIYDGHTSWQVICRVRGSPDASSLRYDRLESDEQGVFQADEWLYDDEGFGYQLGLADPTTGAEIWEAWVEPRVRN